MAQTKKHTLPGRMPPAVNCLTAHVQSVAGVYASRAWCVRELTQGVVTKANVLLEVLLSAPAGAIAAAAATATANERHGSRARLSPSCRRSHATCAPWAPAVRNAFRPVVCRDTRQP